MKKTDSRAGERGAVTIKTLFTFLAVGVVIFSAIKIVPVYTEKRQVIFDVEEIAQKASVRGLKEEDIKKGIEGIRTKYELPEGSIKISSYSQNQVQITLGYTRMIDFIVTNYAYSVDYIANGKAI